MAETLQLIQVMVVCGALLLLAFLILLALPNSQLRAVVLPIVGWGLAICCGCYVFSPADALPEALLGPFGLFDDLVAAGVGYIAYRAAADPGRT